MTYREARGAAHISVQRDASEAGLLHEFHDAFPLVMAHFQQQARAGFHVAFRL